jgi:hypothetical protein
MGWLRGFALLSAAAGCGSLLACGPVHSVTIGRGGPPPEGPPVVVREGGDHGPPPWAPAHGYRRKHQRAYQSHPDTVDMVFDSGLGVYVVVGIPNYYYWDGVYLRIDAGNRWYRAPYLDARWDPCPPDALPGYLREKSIKKYNGPPKGRWAVRDRDDDEQGHGKGKGHGRGRGHGHDDEGDDD